MSSLIDGIAVGLIERGRRDGNISDPRCVNTVRITRAFSIQDVLVGLVQSYNLGLLAYRRGLNEQLFVKHPRKLGDGAAAL